RHAYVTQERGQACGGGVEGLGRKLLFALDEQDSPWLGFHQPFRIFREGRVGPQAQPPSLRSRPGITANAPVARLPHEWNVTRIVHPALAPRGLPVLHERQRSCQDLRTPAPAPFRCSGESFCENSRPRAPAQDLYVTRESCAFSCRAEYPRSC